MRARSTLVYSLLRLTVFVVPLGLMMLIPIMREYYWLSAIFAALIGLSLSLLFLRQPRDELTADLAARRRRGATDEETEDAVVAARSADEGPEQERADGDRGQ